MKIAVIDLGTNTFHLMIVRLKDDGSYTRLYKTKTAVKLGMGGIGQNMITSDSFDRGIKTLESYKRIIDRMDVHRVFAFATSAVRSAENGEDFIDEVFDQTGIEVKIITGLEEAEYIYYGVREALPLDDYKSLIMDIGGGSVEFIIGNQEKIFHKFSFDLGIARLLERFNPSDPITQSEIEIIEGHLRQEMKPLLDLLENNPVHALVGSSGSFDTFAEMVGHRFGKIDLLKDQTTFDFDLNEFEMVHDYLIHSTLEERKGTPGIIPMRVDMIVLASVFVKFILKTTGISQMKLSTYALKEGVLAKMILDAEVLL